MTLLNDAPLLNPPAPPLDSSQEELEAWYARISRFMASVALTLNEGAPYIYSPDQMQIGVISNGAIDIDLSLTTFGSDEATLADVSLNAGTGRVEIVSSALFSTTATTDQVITYRLRKDSLTGTIIRSADVRATAGGAGIGPRVSHTIFALDAAPATTQAYFATVVASAGSAVTVHDSTLKATSFNTKQYGAASGAGGAGVYNPW